MQHVDTLIRAGWIITVDSQFRILKDHTLAILDGRIHAISSDHRPFTASQYLDLSQHILMPGLINAHGHAAMSLFRGLMDDKPLMEWLQHYIWPAEQQYVDPQFVADGTQLAIAEMLRSGTTTFSDMYFFPEIVAKTAAQAGIRAQLSFPVFDVPSNWGSGAEDYLNKGCAIAEQYRDHPLIQLAFGPHAPYTVGDTALKRIRELAEKTGMRIQMHLHETAFEVNSAVEATGQRPLQRIAELGLLGPQFQAVHMTCLNDDDIRLIADSGSHIIHCPESNLKLASGFCPAQRCLDAGINVALGTDGAASNNSLDMFGEMHSAALLAKAVTGNATAIDAATAIRMATINGARALGLEQQTGSLECGKQADIIAIDTQHPAMQPLYHPDSHLVYTRAGQYVSHNWVNGKLLLDNYRLTGIDLPACLDAARRWQHPLSAIANG